MEIVYNSIFLAIITGYDWNSVSYGLPIAGSAKTFLAETELKVETRARRIPISGYIVTFSRLN
jgi:hypothetical protein